MMKSYQITCPKCNNNHNFYRYGKDSDGYQKYQCRACNHQFAPDRPRAGEGHTGRPRKRSYPSCPCCGKATFIHHDYEHYTNYRCSDKSCNHSFFVVKATSVAESSMSQLFGKTNFKRMRYPVYIIITALSIFYLGKSSFRNISLILRTAFNIKVSHTTISNWCHNFAPLFDNMRLQLLPMLDFSSDEWHMDETVVKIAGKKHYLWLIVDSETRFVIGFHLSPHRDSPQAFSLLIEVPLTASHRPWFLTVIVHTKYQLNRYLVGQNIFVLRALGMTFLTISLSASTSNSRLGTRRNKAFPHGKVPTILSPCLSFSSTLCAHTRL